MTLQTKIGIGTLTLGSSAIAGYALLTQKPQGTEISKLIEEEFRYVLLDTKTGDGNTDSALWQTKWESYQKDNQTNERDFFNLDGWTKTQTPNLKDKLREKCETLSKSKIQNKEEKLYEQVVSYCSRDVSIKDQAKKENLDLIDTKDGSADWAKVALKKGELTTDFANLKITASKGAGTEITADDIKKGCVEIVNKHKGEDKYSDIYDSYKKVCTKPKEGS